MTQDTPTSSSSTGSINSSRNKFFRTSPIPSKESGRAVLLSSSISEETSSPRDLSFPSSPAPMSATSATTLLPFSPTKKSSSGIISPIGGPGTLIDGNAFPLIDEASVTHEVVTTIADIFDDKKGSIVQTVKSPGTESDHKIRISTDIHTQPSKSDSNASLLGNASQYTFSKEDSGLQSNSTTSFPISSGIFVLDGPTATSSATTITTTTTTTCPNGATPTRIQIVRKQRIRLQRETCLSFLLALLGIVSSCLLALYLRVIWKEGVESKRQPTVCLTPDCLRASSRILDRMDRTMSPCDNFYQFSCGNYLRKNIVPEDSPYKSSMQEMQQEVLVIIKRMLTSVPSVNESQAMGRARRLYNSCLNTSFTVHEKDMANSPIFDLLTEDRLGLWPMLSKDWNETQYDLEKTLGLLLIYQVPTFFDSIIYPDERNSSVYTLQYYKGSPALSRNYFLNTSNEEYVGYIEAYRALMEEVVTALTGAGSSSFNASQVDDLISFETKFASITDSRACDSIVNSNDTDSMNMTLEAQEDENVARMMVSQLDEAFPGIRWSRMLKVTLDQFDDLDLDVNNLMVTIHCTSYVTELVELLGETPKRVIVNYLLWRFILRHLPYISNYFQQLWQQFNKEVPDPMDERTYVSRWKECATIVNEGFGAALASMYVQKYYDPKTSLRIDSLVEEIRSAFNKVIYRQSWLEQDMKDVCSDKLYLMGKKIGYPEYIESPDLLDAEFEGLDILEDHFLNNILRMKKFEASKELKKLSRPVDKKKDWLIQPLIVNAFHNPSANEMIIPLGMLREPFYNAGYPMYLNYASLGIVVGHELVHGFDNHGKKYDKHGNVSQWWSENMVEQFTERATCFIDQYSQYPIEMVGKNVDGNETLGDNICDNTGLLNAWLGYESWRSKHGQNEPMLPGLNYTVEQIFFIAFGQIWCEVVSKEGYEKYSTDMHSPGIHRTNGALQNSEFFSETWNCPLGSSMNPEKKCKLWV